MVCAGVQGQAAVRISGHRTRTAFGRYNRMSTKNLMQVDEKIGKFCETVTSAAALWDSGKPTAKTPRDQVIELKW